MLDCCYCRGDLEEDEECRFEHDVRCFFIFVLCLFVLFCLFSLVAAEFIQQTTTTYVIHLIVLREFLNQEESKVGETNLILDSQTSLLAMLSAKQNKLLANTCC